jgi:GR25 family glycosyltransferase involved in LPS biosynthesis
MFSKVLCINLATRPDRRAHASGELGRQGLVPFDWIHAHDSHSEAVRRAFSEECSALSALFSMWCRPM